MRALLPLIVLVVVTSCLPTEPPGPPVETVQLTLELGDSTPRFIDFLSGEVVDEEDGWDLRVEGWDLFLNGGESGEGRAGGIDMELLDLTLEFDDLRRKNQILYFFFYRFATCNFRGEEFTRRDRIIFYFNGKLWQRYISNSI